MQTTLSTNTDFDSKFEEELTKARGICSSNPIEGIKMVEVLYAKAETHGSDLLRAKALLHMGLAYYLAKNYSASLEKLDLATVIFEAHDSIIGVANTQNWRGLVYHDLGRLDEALALFFECVKMVETHQLDSLKGRTYSNLGLVYSMMGDKRKAIEYFEQSIHFVKGNKAILLSNIAATYHEIKEPEKALGYLLKAYALNKMDSQILYRGLIVSNMIAVYTDLEDYEQVLQRVRELNGFVGELRQTFFNNVYHGCMVETYIKFLSIASSVEIASEILAEIEVDEVILQMRNTLESSDNLQINTSTCFSLVSYYEQLENWKEVSIFQKKLIELNTQKFEKDKMEATQRLHIQHEVAQKEQKIKIQQLELEKKELELDKKRELENINLQLEEKVAKRTAKLTLQNQQLREFAFIVSHDLREPLCNIHGIADLLVGTYEEKMEGEMKIFVSQIGMSAQYMNRLLKDLLDYTTLEKKIEEEGFQKVDSAEMWKEVKQSLDLEIAANQVEIEESSLPIFETSMAAIRLLFQNLLSNALKFKSANKTVRIKINCIEKAGMYQFSISDNGVGIAPIYQERIFRAFQRLQKNDYQGTGIGLAICKKAVDTLKGTIWVESELGVGSVFYFTVPK
ncbi:MAG: ATP-binding protein [Chitinophagales bacterium]